MVQVQLNFYFVTHKGKSAIFGTNNRHVYNLHKIYIRAQETIQYNTQSIKCTTLFVDIYNMTHRMIQYIR